MNGQDLLLLFFTSEVCVTQLCCECFFPQLCYQQGEELLVFSLSTLQNASVKASRPLGDLMATPEVGLKNPLQVYKDIWGSSNKLHFKNRQK